MKLLRSLLLAACTLACAGGLHAQTYDCRILFSISTTGTNTAPFDNRSTGCDFWTMVYQANGLTGLTLTVQSTFGSTGPGAWVTFNGTVLSGINPNTSITGAQTLLSGFNSFIRVNATFTDGGGALINGVLYGYHSGFNPSPSTACPGTLASPCIVNPYLFNGGAQEKEFVCANSAPVTFSAASGSVQIVSLTSGQTIRVCGVYLASDTPTNITLQYGTGSNCGTGTTSLTGAFQNVTALPLSFASDTALRVPASNAFCVNSSAAATIGGVVTYAKSAGF